MKHLKENCPEPTYIKSRADGWITPISHTGLRAGSARKKTRMKGLKLAPKVDVDVKAVKNVVITPAAAVCSSQQPGPAGTDPPC